MTGAGLKAAGAGGESKMRVKNFKKEENRISFNVGGVDVWMVNILRRIIISEVPVMAIEKVTFYDNASIMNDEFLAHRLGLLPLKTDLKTYNRIKDCTCKGKGCGKCTTIFTLDAKGHKTVYAGDMKSKDPKVVPVYGKTPLVKLGESHHLEFEAVAQLGTGKDHMKWQGGLASYELKDDGSYDFTVESFGQLPVEELLSKAFEVFSDKISELKGQL